MFLNLTHSHNIMIRRSSNLQPQKHRIGFIKTKVFDEIPQREREMMMKSEPEQHDGLCDHQNNKNKRHCLNNPNKTDYIHSYSILRESNKSQSSQLGALVLAMAESLRHRSPFSLSNSPEIKQTHESISTKQNPKNRL